MTAIPAFHGIPLLTLGRPSWRLFLSSRQSLTTVKRRRTPNIRHLATSLRAHSKAQFQQRYVVVEMIVALQFAHGGEDFVDLAA